MPFAVTHVLIPIILVDLARDHLFKEHKRMLPNKYILLAGIAGLLPDIDILIGWFLYFLYGMDVTIIHKLFTHTFIPPLILLVAGVFAYKRIEKRHYWKILTMVGTGLFVHVFLDMIIVGDLNPVYPFYPLIKASFGIGIFPRNLDASIILASIDAILLLLWLIHEEMTHKISNFL